MNVDQQGRTQEEGTDRAVGVAGGTHEPRSISSPVTVLSGVGPERAALLERLGVRTVEDLLLLRPRRYEDRTVCRRIGEVRELGPCMVRGRVVAAGVKWYRRRTRSVFELVLEDGTGRLHCRWWNMPFLEGQFINGEELVVHGKVNCLKPRTIDHPETEVVEGGEEAGAHVGRWVPVYPLTEGLTQRWLRGRMWRWVPEWISVIEEPDGAWASAGLPTRREAVRALHFPESQREADAARKRLAWDEWVGLQREIQGRRQRLYARAEGWRCAGDNRWMRPFLGRLGFALTAAQTRVLKEIRQDLGAGRPMRRLVQGDVGSGKTLVAAGAALMTLESGYDVALMAPTELLARQHGQRFREWWGALGIPVSLRLGGGGSDRDEGDTRTGPRLTVGTHALLGAGYEPDRLGLVIIDEQHKFGVAQRDALVRKGRYPHLLVMTATPIPRTLALTLYGDLDVSWVDELPAGRGRVRTFVRGRSALPKVWEFVRGQLEQGVQAYVVCARVEGDEAGDAGEVRAVKAEYGRLKAALAPHEVGLVHGQIKGEEREGTMTAFREGRVSVLVASSVIEVGVDVPNATLMVIQDAERFGLAQLHQLRGRVRRSGREAFCVLVTGRDDKESRERLRVLEESTDGLAIAEADLRDRGPGELLGAAQSGVAPLRFADFARDAALLDEARMSVARELARSAGTGLD